MEIYYYLLLHQFLKIKGIINVILLIIGNSCILGKIFDIIVLAAQCDSLCTDVLQFGFKKNSSTIICTSLLLDTIEYYN